MQTSKLVFKPLLKTYFQKLAQVNISRTYTNQFIPRRALLYVPGNDERKIEKLKSLNVDCAVLDCEDGVALNKKEEARNTIKKIFENNAFNGKTDVSVRVNSIDSGLFAQDIKVILNSSKIPRTILVPKVENVQQISMIAEELSKNVTNHSLKEKLRLIIYIESARALLDIKEICSAAIEHSRNAPFELEGIVFGSDDFCADIGATRTPEAKELLFARQQIVLVAKAFKLQAIDVVYIDYKDVEGLNKQSLEGYGMGFTGKQVIHPGQVNIVQAAFSPSSEKIDWARELISLFEKHQQSGKGAFLFRGAMIDKPLLLQAQNIIQLANVTSSKI